MAVYEGSQIYWWKEPENQINESVFSYTRFLEKNQPFALENDRRNLRLYGNNDIFGLAPRAYSHNRIDRLKLNIIKSMCDTSTSKISKNKIKPTFLTSGGDYTIQDKAKKLEKFSMGQLYSCGFYEKAPRALLEATILGTGILKLYRIGKTIYIDRVLKPELRVDSADAIHGVPRSLFQIKHIAREVLMEMYPEDADVIKHAKKADENEDRGLSYGSTLSDMLRVIEAWHLKSGCDGKDGRHAIAIEEKTLLDDDYDKCYFPFSFMHWTPPITGFWGVGLGDILTGLQIEINKILKENQDIFHIMDIPKIFIEAGSKIVSSHLDNQIGTIIEYTGTMPNQFTSGQVSQQRFSYLQWLVQSAYELAGVSQLSATAKKPEGLDSGKALRTYHDIETERFISVGRAYEEFTLDVVKQLIDLAKEIDEDEDVDGGYKVLVSSGRNQAQEIKWSDINLDEEKYIMQVFPTNLLPDTPEGKLQYVQEMMQAGLYTPEEGRKLLDFPDTEALNSILNADQEDIDLVIETFREKGEWLSPEAFQNLVLGVSRMQRAYLKAKLDKVPEDRLELFRRWIERAMQMLQPPAPPVPMGEPIGAPVPEGLGGGIPQAGPEPIPTTNLIPNVPGPAITQ